MAVDASGGLVTRLVDAALASAWSYTNDLPWSRAVDPERVGTPTTAFLAASLPDFARMTPREKRALVFRESCFHLSSLLAGERSGERMGAQILAGEERVPHREFLALLVQEEAKHFLSLRRYLEEKARALFAPDRRLAQVLSALEAHPSAALKLLVGQVVLEGTAASLLASLLVRAREPLVAAILRFNLRDEARHVAYSYAALEPAVGRLSRRAVREMEDLVYHSIVACVSSLLAVPVWREAGMAVGPARRAALERLRELGVLQRYTHAVPLQLARRGFPSARVERLLQRGLERSVCAHG